MLVGKAASILKSAKHAVALTGAGISTPSGIPDFRSADTGLWNHVNPLEIASLSAFRVSPEKFFSWFRPFTKQIVNAQPNPAHLALAEMEADGLIKTVITQNIDGLHQKAGSQNVLEVHGSMNTVTCGSCYQQYPTSVCLEKFIDQGIIPRCPSCGGILKPDAILIGEQLSNKTWKTVTNEVNKSDLMIIVGSSLEVFPVAKLPYNVVSSGGRIIIINNQKTYLDERAEIVFHQDVANILPKIFRGLNNG